jgi:hypothetical protein
MPIRIKDLLLKKPIPGFKAAQGSMTQQSVLLQRVEATAEALPCRR